MSLHPIIRTISQLLFAILLVLPAAAQQPAPPIPSTGFPGLDEYRTSRISIYTDDFGQLARYREANAALAPPAAGENRRGWAPLGTKGHVTLVRGHQYLEMPFAATVPAVNPTPQPPPRRDD